MQVRAQRASDMHSINRWLALHRINLISEQSLFSFIVPGVCAGQLLRCEQGIYIFDSFISNPRVSSATRHKAMDSLISYMMQFANTKKLLAFTSDTGTIERAKKFGFAQEDYTVLTYKG